MEVGIGIALLLILFSTIIVASLRGNNETSIKVDGRTFQLPAWAFAEAMQLLTVAEQATIAEVGHYEAQLRRAEKALTRSKSEANKQAVQTAKVAFQRAQSDAQIAVTNGVRRWFNQANGQTWLQSRGLHFPSL